MMRQYQEIKAANQDYLLSIAWAISTSMFFQEREIASRTLASC